MSHILHTHDTYVIKKFGRGLDKINFQRELSAYKALDGHHITPKLLEVGDNCLKIEKYDESLENALIQNRVTQAQYREIYYRITTLVKKLDQLGIIHNDLAPRNIVYNGDFQDIAIIDFEKSIIISDKNSGATNFTVDFYENFSL